MTIFTRYFRGTYMYMYVEIWVNHFEISIQRFLLTVLEFWCHSNSFAFLSIF